MSSCLISSSKFIGVTLLGLLAGKLIVHVYETIPYLISSLSHQVTLRSGVTGNGKVVKKTTSTLNNTNSWLQRLTLVSSSLLLLAYFISTPSGKHPYLLYSAFAAPVALVLDYYSNYSSELQLNDKLAVLLKFENEGSSASASVSKESDKVVEDIQKSQDSVDHSDDDLTRSYIHVSDEDEASSSSLTPSDGSPLVTTADDLNQEISIEEEIQIVLLKKEIAQDLEKVRSGYIRSASVAGIGFIVATIGLIGEYFLF